MPAHPSLQGSGRDEASAEAAHQEKETTTILDECRKLTEAENEFGRDIIFVVMQFMYLSCSL
jgi:hypothetical protein